MRQAPELATEGGWLNAEQPLSLAALRGRVVAVFAFQMLCPGCVKLSLPQAQAVHDIFSEDDLAVIGLHTVFEHHAAMGRASLEAFVSEYRLTFPIAIDRPSKAGAMPETMALYAMQGTPTLLLIDRQGRLRKSKFGHENDIVLGAEIMALIRERDQDSELSA